MKKTLVSVGVVIAISVPVMSAVVQQTQNHEINEFHKIANSKINAFANKEINAYLCTSSRMCTSSDLS